MPHFPEADTTLQTAEEWQVNVPEYGEVDISIDKQELSTRQKVSITGRSFDASGAEAEGTIVINLPRRGTQSYNFIGEGTVGYQPPLSGNYRAQVLTSFAGKQVANEGWESEVPVMFLGFYETWDE